MFLRGLLPILFFSACLLILSNCKKDDNGPKTTVYIHDTTIRHDTLDHRDTIIRTDTVIARDTAFIHDTLIIADTTDRPIIVDYTVIGAQNSLVGGFNSPSRNEHYKAAHSFNFMANRVDFSYAVLGGSANTPYLTSLNGRRTLGLGTVNTINRPTLFGTTMITKQQYDTVSNAYLLTLVAGTAQGTSLAVGKVYKFQNAEGRKGLIYIIAKDPYNNGNLTIGCKLTL